jgi:hypothetical protein
MVAVGGADGRAQQRVIDHIPEGDLVLKIRQLGLEGDESRTDGDPGLELDEDV